MIDLLKRHFISLFLIFLFSVRLASQRSAKDKEFRYFWLTVVSCFLLVVEDHLEGIASLHPEMRLWRTVRSVAGYTLRCMASAGLVFIVCKPEHKNRLIWWVPCILNFLVCMTAFFTDAAFGFDENYTFYRGPLGYISFIVPAFYLLLILMMTFRRYSDNRRRTDQVILIACALFCFLSSLLDANYGGVRLHEAIMISCVFFYLFLRSYDVRKDALTSVLNRQALYDDCNASGEDICAAASLDMNGLKKLNDRLGHSAGDTALKKIGECIRESIAEDMAAYRTGGDEFVVLFFQNDENMIRETLEKIQDSTAKAGYSVSCGYAMRSENETPEELIRISDIKMFEQKALYYREKKHDRRQARREKTDAEPAETRRTFEESPQPIAIYQFSNHRAEILYVSDGFCMLFGYPDRKQAVHILDQDMYRDVHADDEERLRGAMLRFSEGTDDLDVVYRTKAGMKTGYRIVHARGIHMHTDTGKRIAHVWYMDEGSYTEGDRKPGSLMNQALSKALHEESILNASYFDSLTGLPCLAWFFTLCEAGRTQERSEALLYIDLNGMKYFNDKYGFAEGDKLLKAVSGILSRIFGKEKTCHIAADRFAASAAEEGLEKKLKNLISEAENLNDGKTLPVRIGVYPFNPEDASVSIAFDRAKMACDSIRHTDTSCINYYRQEMSDALKKRQYVIANIDRAIREKWIVAYYQPIVRAEDGQLCDEEALARWIDPTEGFLSPDDFIPQLEDTGLICKLDLFILEQVVEKIRICMDKGIKVVPHSINLSRSDFETCDIVEEVCKRIDGAGISREMINIEITESVIGENFDYINEQVKRFRERGFSIWMDDFGSGYSSLDVLQSIQFDLIKFDMSFMRKLDEGENGRIILTELMELAGHLKLDTVCEGVEKEEQAAFLRKIGCRRLQGYFFGKPAPWNPAGDYFPGNAEENGGKDVPYENDLE